MIPLVNIKKRKVSFIFQKKSYYNNLIPMFLFFPFQSTPSQKMLVMPMITIALDNYEIITVKGLNPGESMLWFE